MTPEELEEARARRKKEKEAGGGGGKRRDPSKWAHEKLGDDDSDDGGGGGAWRGKTGNVDEEDLRDLYEEKAELQEQTRDDINAQAQLTEVLPPLRPFHAPPPPSSRGTCDLVLTFLPAPLDARIDQGEADRRYRQAPQRELAARGRTEDVTGGASRGDRRAARRQRETGGQTEQGRAVVDDGRAWQCAPVRQGHHRAAAEQQV